MIDGKKFEMDQGRGLWDLLFGVNDPDAAIKMEACQEDTTILDLVRLALSTAK